MIRGPCLLLCLALTGCVSVPLSTMVRMSTFDERDFAQLDPEVLRVRIRLPAAFALDAARSALGVRITAAAGEHRGEFRLDPERVDPTLLPGGLLAADVPGRGYTLRLSAESIVAFRQLQDFVAGGPPSGVVISVAPRLSAFPDDARQVRVWVDLRLREGQDFFTLLDAAEIPMDALRAEGTRRAAPGPG